MADARKQRDIWDKLEVIGRITSGVLLAVIAIVLKTGSDQISLSLQRGNLVQNLIADLTTGESRARQDVALLALDHSVGAASGPMVADIAERIFLDLRTADTAAVDAESESLGSVAFVILERRDAARAAEWRRRVLDISDPGIRASLRSAPDTGQLAAATSEPPDKARLLARALQNVVYVQFRGNVTREDAEALRSHLGDAGYNVPGTERVDAEYRNWVRYFHDEDRTLADSVAAETRGFLSGRGHELELNVQNLSGRGFRAQRGQIEIWLSY